MVLKVYLKKREFAENPYMQIYKIQPDLYSKEIIDYVLNRARSMGLAVREIKGVTLFFLKTSMV